MRRDQIFHERLIPLLVEGVGARTYLELGTYLNDTIHKVRCRTRIGVDIKIEPSWRGIELYEMSTTQFIQDIAPELETFDVVFIDADHSADSVRSDFVGIWPFVSHNGLVLLHDTNPHTEADTAPGYCGDAWRAAEQIAKGHECVTLNYHPGLTIVRKRLKWGPFE